ncbi:inositol monophosphatase family protein [Candidatus Latescibacterota bacterium]
MKPLTEDDKKSFLATAIDAAKESGEIILRSFGKQNEISYKGRIDIVTDVDIKSEKAIIKIIKSRFPGHDIITEENNPELKSSKFRWIIDPIDGTVNYAHNYPFVAVSIALEIDGIIETGVVYNPIMEEFFSAGRGQGAFLNDVPIEVSKTETLEKSFLATGFPYDIKENPENNLKYFNHLIMRAQAIRRDGSASLNLCYTAMGRFDGFWELRLSPWDLAAGYLIATEAGGRISKMNGNPFSVYEPDVIITNGLIHEELLKEFESAAGNNI